MTLAELITDLQSKSDVLDTNTPQLISTEENIKKYEIPTVLDRGDDLVVTTSQKVLVIDEGETSEAAYYNGGKIFRETTTTFNEEVNARANSFEGTVLGAGTQEERTIVKVTIQQVFQDRKAATVKAFFDDGSSLSALLYKDDSDNWKEQILS